MILQNCYKFTYADIVYITEADCITEFTSDVLPVKIPKAVLTNRDHVNLNVLAKKMLEMPDICILLLLTRKHH